MTSINLPKDDSAVREARIKNSATPSVDAVKPTAQTGETQPVNPHQATQQPRTAIRQRKKKDRRQGERRQRQENVLLDTRSHRERRKSVRRSSDAEAQQENEQSTTGSRGIDVYS
jgi:hypothetical protein